jgi:hypothetical protein
MFTLVIPSLIFAAATGGLGILAYGHPRAYKLIETVLLLVSLAIFVFLMGWNMGITDGCSALHSAGGNIDLGIVMKLRDACEAKQIPHVLRVYGPVLAYLVFLRYFPHSSKLEKDKKFDDHS